MCDVYKRRRVMDLILKFEPNQQIFLHWHLVRLAAGIAARGGKAAAIRADIAVVADIHRLFRDTIAKKRVESTLWLTTTANPGPVKSIAEVSEDKFAEVFALNVCGAFFVMQGAARALPDRRIINVSAAATTILPPFASLYVGSKNSDGGFSSILANELAVSRHHRELGAAWRG